jgi:hypothetical protein
MCIASELARGITQIICYVPFSTNLDTKFRIWDLDVPVLSGSVLSLASGYALATVTCCNMYLHNTTSCTEISVVDPKLFVTDPEFDFSKSYES